MSKQIKQNCSKMIIKLFNKLQELKLSIKLKKNQSALEKYITQIINDFKYFQDQFHGLCIHNQYLQTKVQTQETQISNLSTQLLSKSAQKQIYEKMIKKKYEKIIKQQNFQQFSKKNIPLNPPKHQRHQSQLIKKGLNQLQKEILESNIKVRNRVKQLQFQIQNEEQRYFTLKKTDFSKNMIPDLSISRILPEKRTNNQLELKTLDKRIKMKNICLNFQDDITAYKTSKKQLALKEDQDSKEQDAKSSETFIINKKKKQQLAELIAKQTKFIVTGQKYFSTDV